jgi:hypothetical protein
VAALYFTVASIARDYRQIIFILVLMNDDYRRRGCKVSWINVSFCYQTLPVTLY